MVLPINDYLGRKYNKTSVLSFKLPLPKRKHPNAIKQIRFNCSYNEKCYSVHYIHVTSLRIFLTSAAIQAQNSW